MRLVGGAIIASLLAASAAAQQLLLYGDSALPTCAQQCTVLQNAQAGCIPPAAPVTDNTIYESCFCQSGYLAPLKAAGSTLCADVCGAADVAKVATWYQSNCADNGVAAAAKVSTGAGTSTTAATAMSTAATAVSTAASASSAKSTASSQGSASGQQEKAQHGWWYNHWKWVVMIIIIFLGLGVFTFIFVLLRRRYLRRRDDSTTPFNSGITRHSLPASSATPPPNLRTGSNHASRTSLPGVREKDRMDATNVPVPPLPAVYEKSSRAGTPDMNQGRPS